MLQHVLYMCLAHSVLQDIRLDLEFHALGTRLQMQRSTLPPKTLSQHTSFRDVRRTLGIPPMESPLVQSTEYFL